MIANQHHYIERTTDMIYLRLSLTYYLCKSWCLLGTSWLFFNCVISDTIFNDFDFISYVICCAYYTNAIRISILMSHITVLLLVISRLANFLILMLEINLPFISAS